MFKERYDKMKTFVKDHKAELMVSGVVVGGLLLRKHDLKTMEKHLIDIIKLIDRDGDCIGKLTDIVEHHGTMIKLNDEELRMIGKVIKAQGSLNHTVAEAIVELRDK